MGNPEAPRSGLTGELLRFAIESVELLASRFQAPARRDAHLLQLAEAALESLQQLAAGKREPATPPFPTAQPPIPHDARSDGDEQTCLIAKMVVSALVREYEAQGRLWELARARDAYQDLTTLLTQLDASRLPAATMLGVALPWLGGR